MKCIHLTHVYLFDNKGISRTEVYSPAATGRCCGQPKKSRGEYVTNIAWLLYLAFCKIYINARFHSCNSCLQLQDDAGDAKEVVGPRDAENSKGINLDLPTDE